MEYGLSCSIGIIVRELERYFQVHNTLSSLGSCVVLETLEIVSGFGESFRGDWIVVTLFICGDVIHYSSELLLVFY